MSPCENDPAQSRAAAYGPEGQNRGVPGGCSVGFSGSGEGPGGVRKGVDRAPGGRGRGHRHRNRHNRLGGSGPSQPGGVQAGGKALRVRGAGRTDVYQKAPRGFERAPCGPHIALPLLATSLSSPACMRAVSPAVLTDGLNQCTARCVKARLPSCARAARLHALWRRPAASSPSHHRHPRAPRPSPTAPRVRARGRPRYRRVRRLRDGITAHCHATVLSIAPHSLGTGTCRCLTVAIGTGIERPSREIG